MENNKRLFRKLSVYFKDNVKLSHVIRYNVLIVTNDDRVYQIDEYLKETYSSIAYTSDESEIKSLIEKSILEELCYKGVIEFNSSYTHTIARTFDGKVYVWGENMYGVIGNGLDDITTYEPKLNEFLSHLKIIDISCGDYHSLALTSNGDVYAWGLNESGQIGIESGSVSQLRPVKINFSTNEKLKAISCGAYHSMVLTESGRVFSWGENDVGQLGVGNFTDANKPELIEMNDILFEKICCSSSFSFCLSADGDIYVCGCHHWKYLEYSNSRLRKLNKLNKFCDIKSVYVQNFFAALSMDGLYYIWGELKMNEEIITELKEIPNKSFTDIFREYLQINYRSIEGMLIEFEDGFIRNKYCELNYNEIDKLGEGSFGIVFKVNHRKNYERFYAIKKINLKNEKEILKELQIFFLISEIKHKNVVRYKNVWLENNFIKKGRHEVEDKSLTLHIQLELCDLSLDDFLVMIEDLELEETHGLPHLKYYISSALFLEILEGVNYLHKHKPQIIHRDLRPDNILLKLEKNNKLVVKIADFGLVTIHKFAEQLHEPDVGQVKYMAPEVGKSDKYDTKADIFSLGVILRDLFDVDPDDGNYSSFLMSKYQKISEIYSKMTSEFVDERPECDEMLRVSNRSSWVLNAVELLKNGNEFDKIDKMNFGEKSYVVTFMSIRIIEELQIIDKLNKTIIPTNSDMCSLEKRKSSFVEKGWDQSIPVSVDKLSDAGFYFTGMNDMVKCFHCSGGLSKWTKEDDPWIAHMTHFPDCHFVKFKKAESSVKIAREDKKRKHSHCDSDEITG